MKIVVTGASGYIGTRFIKLAQTNNHEIVAASRRSLETASLWLPFDLNASATFSLPEDVDAILHLAADTTENGDGRNEIAAAKTLVAAASHVGAKFVFVSSQTARENAPTGYGRTKWCIEQEVLAANGLVVRPGQVYGGVEGGLFGTLVGLVRHFSVLPAFVPPPLIQPIHVDDFTKGLLTLIERDEIRSGVYCIASPDGVSFTDFLRSIAQHRIRHCKIFVPIPVSFVRFFITLLGAKLSAKFGLNRLSSLFDLPMMSTATDLDLIELKLRPLSSGMHCSGNDRRRRLIQEGMALLAYVLKVKPSSVLVRRYVRMIESLRNGIPLALPRWLFYSPTILALVDDRAFANLRSGQEFSWCVDAATVIAEASVQGAARFLGVIQSVPQLVALGQIFLALSAEVFWRLVSIIAFPLILRVKN